MGEILVLLKTAANSFVWLFSHVKLEPLLVWNTAFVHKVNAFSEQMRYLLEIEISCIICSSEA